MPENCDIPGKGSATVDFTSCMPQRTGDDARIHGDVTGAALRRGSRESKPAVTGTLRPTDQQTIVVIGTSRGIGLHAFTVVMIQAAERGTQTSAWHAARGSIACFPFSATFPQPLPGCPMKRLESAKADRPATVERCRWPLSARVSQAQTRFGLCTPF
jgi:hypothetical protein